ncbi:MAG TPA: hypothetical protein VGD36_11635, partial [Xanthobacteraceae bacterium]
MLVFGTLVLLGALAALQSDAAAAVEPAMSLLVAAMLNGGGALAAMVPAASFQSTGEEEFAPDRLKEANERLKREIAAHEATLRELEAVRRELELRVAERTKELSLVKARFETALRGAKVSVLSQDRDLRYTWVYTPGGGEDSSELLGRTDEELLPA